MTDGESVRLTITQEADYEFRIRFEETAIAELATDESPPIGHDKGPSPTRLLGSAIGTCLSSSLLFAMRKYKNAPGRIVARVRVDTARNERGRLRVAKIAADIDLHEAAADYQNIERLLAQFEDFCTITESVRHGIPVDVRVVDATGAVLHTSADAA
jgi:uncharacterized OsmC-like protein